MRSHYFANRDNLDKWEKRMQEEIRSNHQGLLEFGRGGRGKVLQSDRVATERYLREVEFPALAKFKQAIAEGKVSEQQIRSRIAAYARHGKVSYEQGVKSQNIEEGRKEARRLLGSCKNHCADCLRYAALGWIDVGDLVLPGDKCLCLANFCCSVEYRTRQRKR